ncbi:MAG: hypothetical protein SGI84_02135 [Gemmatimonadota bacterium]|nr:hypothetical protein [Gemmatimonadota bacterium]
MSISRRDAMPTLAAASVTLVGGPAVRPRRYSDDTVKLLLGGNWLRVLTEL